MFNRAGSCENESKKGVAIGGLAEECQNNSTSMRTVGLTLLSISLCATMLGAQEVSSNNALPPSVNRIFQEGLSAQRDNNLSIAIQRYRDVVDQLPTFVPAWFNLGLALDQEGNSVSALDCFEEVLHRAPGYPYLHLFIGIEEVKLNRPELAVRDLNAATQESPLDERSWFWLARARLLSHQDDAAMAAALQSEHIAPNDPSVEFLIATIYIDEQHWQESEAKLRAIERANPNLPHVHEALAEVFYAEARMDDALSACRAELEINPDSLKSRAMTGMILADRGDYSEAIPYLTEVSQQSPGILEVHSNSLRRYGVKDRFKRH